MPALSKTLGTFKTDEIFYDREFNNRDDFTPQSCIELAESMRIHGLHHPVVLQPRKDVPTLPEGYNYRLICGHRRFISATWLLSWTEIEGMLVTGLTEEEAKFYNLLENLERKNLSVYEEAHALKKLFPKGTSISAISKKLQKSRGWCRVRWRLFELPEHIQENVKKRILTAYDLQVILAGSKEEQIRTANELLNAKLTGESSNRIRVKKLRRSRGRNQIFNMITKLMASGGFPSPFTALLWAAGDLSDEELLSDEI